MAWGLDRYRGNGTGRERASIDERAKIGVTHNGFHQDYQDSYLSHWLQTPFNKKGSAMGTDHIWFLHMDERWMHRVCLASDCGHIVVRSQGFFRLEDAKQALAQVMHSEVVLAKAA